MCEVEALLQDKEKLTAILTYHVVAGKYAAKDVMGMSSAKTVNGQSLMLKVVDAPNSSAAAQIVKEVEKAQAT